MPSVHIHHRRYWSFFLAAWFLMAGIINFCVRAIDSELHREGISSRVLISCRSVLLDAVDIETGLRGLLITGKREFLQPYYEGASRVDRNIDNLITLTRSDPIESPHARQAAICIGKLIKELHNQAELFEKSGLEPARKRFLDFPTKPTMDEVRGELGAIQSEEDHRLAVHLSELNGKMNATVQLLNIFTAVLAVLMIAMLSGMVEPPTSRTPYPSVFEEAPSSLPPLSAPLSGGPPNDLPGNQRIILFSGGS